MKTSSKYNNVDNRQTRKMTTHHKVTNVYGVEQVCIQSTTCNQKKAKPHDFYHKNTHSTV